MVKTRLMHSERSLTLHRGPDVDSNALAASAWLSSAGHCCMHVGPVLRERFPDMSGHIRAAERSCLQATMPWQRHRPSYATCCSGQRLARARQCMCSAHLPCQIPQWQKLGPAPEHSSSRCCARRPHAKRACSCTWTTQLHRPNQALLWTWRPMTKSC